MQTPIDEQLRSEAKAYGFCFGCERCVHFVPDTRRCAHEYPTAPHLGIDLERQETLVFCKHFELW